MNAPDRKGYRHRQNADDTVDSICLRCFRTIATGANENFLAQSEEAHHCAPEAVTTDLRIARFIREYSNR